MELRFWGMGKLILEFLRFSCAEISRCNHKLAAK
jgi:hypothetical protein